MVKREQVFCLILTIIVSGVFLAAVAITFRPGNTTIIMGADSGGTLFQEEAGGNASYGNASSGKGGAGTDADISAAESGTSSDLIAMPVPPTWELPEDWWPELPEAPGASEESPASSDPGPSSDPDPSSGETPDFSAAEQLAGELEEAYALSITLNTTGHPVDPESAFSDGNAALAAVQSLGSVCGAFGDLLPALSQKGYQVQMILSSADSTGLSASLSGRQILFRLAAGPDDWRFSFACAVTSALDSVLLEMTEAETLYAPYRACNPGSFSYGTPDFSLIRGDTEATCFLDVTCQRSVQDDRSRLYAYAALDMVPAGYLMSGCPLYQKIQVLEAQYRQYILS